MNTLTFDQFVALAGNQAAIDLYRVHYYYEIVAGIIERSEEAETEEESARIEDDEDLMFWSRLLEEVRGRFRNAQALAQAVFEATAERESAYTVGANAVDRRAESLVMLMKELATDPEDTSDETVVKLRDAAVAEYEKPHPDPEDGF